ncbi:hypothetical protein B5M50_05015 [candidate division KSB1 bacterium 4484_219]|nr:MAG: hypothetical protein B5M50_05015 [candidate division KSB1 bacterium 4484_219]
MIIEGSKLKDIIRIVPEQKFWITGFILAAVFLGCATTKWESNNSQTDTQEARWRKGIEYSRHIYHEPVDFLRDEPFIANQDKDQKQKSQISTEKIRGNQQSSTVYRVQLAAFRSREAAQKMAEAFRHRSPGDLCRIDSDGKWWRVQVGEFTTRAEAELKREQLIASGYHDAWIVQSVK